MKIVRFSVKNFRSITTARSLKLYGTTVLIGPNNEGKSNLVKALAKALNTLTVYRQAFSRYRFATGSEPHSALLLTKSNTFVLSSNVFDWSEDYPISFQSNSTEPTEFWVEFALDEHEVAAFRQKIGSNLNGNLPFHIAIDRQNQCTIKVKKPGRGQRALTAKSDQIAHFIAERLDFEHIPAIRTADTAARVVDQLVSERLSTVEGTA